MAQALEASPAERSASGEAALRPAALSAELRAALEERGTVEETGGTGARCLDDLNGWIC